MATDSGTKRRREGDGLTPLDGRTSAELVSQHYSSRKGQDWADRKRSDVISLREYNNWVRQRRVCGTVTVRGASHWQRALSWRR